MSFCIYIVVGWPDDGVISSDDDEYSGCEAEEHDGAVKGEDRELKSRLLQKYGGHISSLKLEFSKKKKKGKLPKDARQILLEWWKGHYRWPYPTVIFPSPLININYFNFSIILAIIIYNISLIHTIIDSILYICVCVW